MFLNIFEENISQAKPIHSSPDELHSFACQIYIVVGFMKEQFEYLIDEFGVELIVNENYSSKNSLHFDFNSASSALSSATLFL